MDTCSPHSMMKLLAETSVIPSEHGSSCRASRGTLCSARALLCALLLLTTAAAASDLKLPQHATAGTAVTIGTSGSGNATFYLVGPTARIKRSVRLGEDITLKPEDTRQAGSYQVLLRAEDGTICRTFFVDAATVSNLSFLAQPSRVAAGARDAISGTAFVMDAYRNLVLTPTPVKFELNVEGVAPIVRTVNSRDGLAWTRMDSSHRAGNAQFTASAGEAAVKRVVQQTASDPCNLRIHAQPAARGVLIETDPVRDCAGNAVPDGTIVTFTSLDPNGRSTVDARVKQGIARAMLPAAPGASISAASGVVMGNEIRWGGGR